MLISLSGGNALSACKAAGMSFLSIASLHCSKTGNILPRINTLSSISRFIASICALATSDSCKLNADHFSLLGNSANTCSNCLRSFLTRAAKHFSIAGFTLLLRKFWYAVFSALA
ncbi:Uncharacterised protein [Legionella pneumophila]|nr:Uncharacterised protein [Legionella pneumophila]